MNIVFKNIGILLGLLTAMLFTACKQPKPEVAQVENIQSLSDIAREEQRRKINEKAAQIAHVAALRAEKTRLARAADSVQNALHRAEQRSRADSINAAERQRLEAAEREREERLREEAYQNELEDLRERVPKPITGLYLLYGEGPAPRGYTKINRDLNKGAGGDFIYLCYTKDPSKGKPITAIKATLDTGWNHIPSNYKPFGCSRRDQNGLCDVNREAGGAYIFLFMSRKKVEGDPITEVDIAYGDQVQRQDWTLLDKDLNKGAGGDFVWLGYSRK